MIKGRDHQTKGAPAAADLLVCFPSRAHLSLMPKPICSPARSSEPNKRHHHSHHHHHRHLHHHLKKSSTRGSTSTGQASPLLWAKPKSSMGSSELVSEPTSPKVTCAGQIKVRHKSTTSCKSWQSVMEEIERMHNSRRKQQQKKAGRARPSWAEALGLKKDVMNFLACLRNIRLDFRCFGSFHSGTDITTDDEDEDEEEEEEEDDEEVAGYRENRGPLRGTDSGASEGSRTVFSKWFMVLQEEQNYDNDNNINSSSNSSSTGFFKEDRVKMGVIGELKAAPGGDEGSGGGGPAVPPPNALLLMRCRSAPAKSWLEEKEEEESEDEKEEIEEQEEEEERERDEEKRSKSSLSLKCLMEEEKRKTTESSSSSLVVMRYDTDHFYKISSDIAKETWVVGGIRDPLSRSRSWKR
ncbi:nucleolar GTP-binding protein [Trema orientale]|uniref:Nucleolar GTP-binding protein n=1 Tax=Trema orientale TaxID=63057 RepID=A0A2P5G1X1_TREOI|nr:nucleolar GTP-binding protein [Trema orientale]